MCAFKYLQVEWNSIGCQIITNIRSKDLAYRFSFIDFIIFIDFIDTPLKGLFSDSDSYVYLHI